MIRSQKARWSGLSVAFCLGLFISLAACADDSVDVSRDDGQASSSRGLWDLIVGDAVKNRLYAGMWTIHTHASSRAKDNATNDALSYTYHGYFAGVFKNSYYNWTYAAGVQRSLYESKLGTRHSELAVGYRAGGMVGYDDRLCSWCGDSPVLPMVMPYMDYQYKNLGIESQYGLILFTIGFYYNFS